ncbi:hypothetical protein [Streptomyces sp. NBC_00470]|uniref:hypothetical protein n=1 Tax=Streptomyces sp. NBC_00470 TaxID=2975753 RepID=UPI002F912B7A
MTDIVQVPSLIGGYTGATLHLSIDHTEHARRTQAGLRLAIGHGFGGLDHLMSLPTGLPVPLADLSEQQRAYVSTAPAGICSVHGGFVTRHVVRPCRITLAAVHYDALHKLALDSALRFTSVSACQVVVERLPRYAIDQHELLEKFAFYGIGVSLRRADGSEETVLEPRRFRPKQHTPAAWFFAERAYDAYLLAFVEDAAGPMQFSTAGHVGSVGAAGELTLRDPR